MSLAIAAYRGYLNPSTDAGFSPRQGEYEYLWARYQNQVFERIASADPWGSYRGTHRLFPFIRSLYNPTRRLVDFQSAAIYPGVLSPDGSKLPDGVPLAIPLSDDTDPKLREAIAQFWAWSNWQSQMGVMTVYGGALGDVAVEVLDEVERGKVTAMVHWPGHVADMERDTSENVKDYKLEYQAARRRADGTTETFTFRREVTREWIREYDGETRTFEEENWYGFAPLVWVKHHDTGGDHGAPALRSSAGKIDALNDLASRIHHQIARVIDSPQVLWSDGKIQNAIDADTAATLSEQERRLTVLKGPAGGRTDTLAGNLDLAAAFPYLEKLLSEIEADHPELSTFANLRTMSAITGPAASRLLGDVQTIIQRIAANYDRAMISLHGMAVAIGGERLKRGDWGAPTLQQQAFAGFDLESYERGRLEHSIDARPLVPELLSEKWAAEKLRAETAAAWYDLLGSRVAALDRVGVTEEELTKLFTDKAAVIAAERLLGQSDLPLDGSEVPEL